MGQYKVVMRTTRWGVVAAAAVAGCVFSASGTSAVMAGSAPARGAAVVHDGPRSNFSDGKWGDATADSVSKDAYGKNAAEKDPGSLFTVGKAIAARNLWAKKDMSGRAVTGQGVGVAVLDSGVSQVPGLNGAGKVTYGPDLSIESNGPLSQQDTFGHGTFMAGIIAGRGAANPSSDLASAPANVQLGIAPDAKLLAIKLATTDGSTDVSQVIAALDWVTAAPGAARRHPRSGSSTCPTAPTRPSPTRLDPLAAAAENAWRHGIVVVDLGRQLKAPRPDGSPTRPVTPTCWPSAPPTPMTGPTAGRATTPSGRAFSNVASTGRHADLVAPARRWCRCVIPVLSWTSITLRGGYPVTLQCTLFRGSGTSQAAAVVSGAVADLLQAFPTLTPDQVKYALTSTAPPVSNSTPAATGAGVINLQPAWTLASHLLGSDQRVQRCGRPPSSPSRCHRPGSIEQARGGSVVVDPTVTSSPAKSTSRATRGTPRPGRPAQHPQLVVRRATGWDRPGPGCAGTPHRPVRGPVVRGPLVGGPLERRRLAPLAGRRPAGQPPVVRGPVVSRALVLERLVTSC